MKMFSSRLQNERAQSGAEYMILLGVTVAVTLGAFGTYLPEIVKDGTAQECSTNKCGYATKLFSNIVKKINNSNAGSRSTTSTAATGATFFGGFGGTTPVTGTSGAGTTTTTGTTTGTATTGTTTTTGPRPVGTTGTATTGTTTTFGN